MRCFTLDVWTKFTVTFCVIFLILTPDCSQCTLQEGRDLISEITTFFTRKFLPIAQDVFFEVEVSSECSGSLLKMISALRRREPWALKSKFARNGLFCFSIGTFLLGLRSILEEKCPSHGV